MLQQADKMCCREFVTAQVAFHKNYHDPDDYYGGDYVDRDDYHF